ncbi:MAG TPA: hypothetical protein VFZ77_13695 [Acidimicrobiales bacterium]
MTLVWAAPVAAAAVASLLLAARGRALEDEAGQVAGAVRRLAELRRPLAAIRSATEETGTLAEAFGARHPLDGDGRRPGAP